MSFIAGIAFERKMWAAPNQYHQLGKIWYNACDHNCSLLLNGFRMGHLVAKPYDQDNAPYLKGDIRCVTDEYEKEGSMVKNYQWCGWIYTDTDQRGPIYQLVFEVNPMAMLLANAINRKGDHDLKPGLFLSVHLEDKDERQKVERKNEWIKPEIVKPAETEEEVDLLGQLEEQEEDNIIY